MTMVITGDGTITGLVAGGLPDASVIQADLAPNVVGKGPAFDATAAGSQVVSSGAYSKVLFATENYDTNNNFASSTFTPTVAGYYQIGCNVTLGTTTGEFVIAIYKNGSVFRYLLDYTPTSTYAFSSGVLVSMNGSTDYLEIYVYQSSGSNKTVSSYSYFQGFLARSS